MNKSYVKYLRKNKKWKAIKAGAKNDDLFNVCLVNGCNETYIDLHHTTYENMGTKKEYNDLIPLCRLHHKQVHELHKAENLTLLEATEEIVNQ